MLKSKQHSAQLRVLLRKRDEARHTDMKPLWTEASLVMRQL